MWGFVLADWLTRQQQRWSDISPGIQAQASGNGTCGSARPMTVPSSQKEYRDPCLALRPVPVVQVPLLLHHLQSVPSGTPLWPPSPLWMSPPVGERSYRESRNRVSLTLTVLQRPLLEVPQVDWDDEGWRIGFGLFIYLFNFNQNSNFHIVKTQLTQHCIWIKSQSKNNCYNLQPAK